MFRNRKLVIATKHEKERVLAPILEKALGVECFVPEHFDTDALGTFTGEIERKLDPIATLRQKCLLAMELTGCDLGVASEGSFGPHPTMLFVSADDEFLIFIDKKNGLEIIARELSLETNYNAAAIKTEKDLDTFADNAQFPTHALIIKKAKDDFTEIVKGITNREILINTFQAFIRRYGAAYLETDMRALYNPSRMKVIEKAAHKLVEKITALCPQCAKPGFAITDARTGLPCDLCGLPTRSVLSYISVCQHCQYQQEAMFPHQKKTEDPTYCDFCNP